MKTKTFIKAFLWGCLVILFPVASGTVAGIARLDTVPALFLQGAFMALSLAVPLILLLCGKFKISDTGFGGFNAAGCKRALYFIPVAAIYIPAAVAGFYIKSVPYVLGCLFLYLFVGIAEEVYFRGIVPFYLSKAFSVRGVVILSTVIFGIGHTATAFSGGGAFDTALTVLNAFIFGWLASEIALLSGNIAVPVLLHFLFDFETKITAISGTALALAEGIRGTLMFAAALWLAFVLSKANKAPAETDAQQRSAASCRSRRRKGLKAAGIACAAVILAAGIALTALSAYGRKQQGKIPAMSFEDCLAYTLGGKEDGVITVGIIKDGKASCTVYGRDGKVLPDEPRSYEIGSLTKTFTAALVQKAVNEGRINTLDTLDKYLPLPDDNSYPTIAELLTHTSGYRSWYLESPMIKGFFTGRNDYYGITGDMILSKLGSLNTYKKDKDYRFVYSNFGYAVLGQVLESVYGEEYTTLVESFAAEISLSSTHISAGRSEPVTDGWDWCADDAYMSAGALVSDIGDMLKYAQYQLDGGEIFGRCHETIKDINASTGSNRLMDINMDSVGMAWITDNENGFVWHNGGTGSFNCYLGFKPASGTAVVILSDFSPSYRIPATVMGIKLLKEIQ